MYRCILLACVLFLALLSCSLLLLQFWKFENSHTLVGYTDPTNAGVRDWTGYKYCNVNNKGTIEVAMPWAHQCTTA